jgi:hypothetical protein
VDGTGATMLPNHNVVVGDPLSNVTAPTATGMSVQSTSPVTYGKTNPPTNNTLQPGIYCGGISFNDTGGVWYTLTPGIYVLAGGGLKVNSSAMVQGTGGVTFYSTSGSFSPACGNSSIGNISINGQAQMNLKAPASGNCVGMLFFEDRTLYGGGATINGGASSSFDGALYFKNSSLQFAGTNSTNGYMVLVADTISINGTTTLGNNYSTLSDPNPFAPASTGGGLVE